MTLDKLTHEMFAEHLNEIFVLREETVAMNLELTEVTNLGPRRPNAREAFSLVFQAPKDSPYMRQKIYSIEHETMETMNIFIVPIGPGQYEAVFT